jgi:hypothetical protein
MVVMLVLRLVDMVRRLIHGDSRRNLRRRQMRRRHRRVNGFLDGLHGAHYDSGLDLDFLFASIG